MVFSKDRVDGKWMWSEHNNNYDSSTYNNLWHFAPNVMTDTTQILLPYLVCCHELFQSKHLEFIAVDTLKVPSVGSRSIAHLPISLYYYYTSPSLVLSLVNSLCRSTRSLRLNECK